MSDGCTPGLHIVDGVVTVHMSGCGGLYPYMFGVCGALQDMVDMRKVCFATASGSTPAAGAVSYNAPAKPALELFERRRRSLLRAHGIAIYMNDLFIRMAIAHNLELGDILSDDEWRAHACANHRVMVVSKETNERQYLSDFDDFRSYVYACGSSASFAGIPTKDCAPDWEYGHAYGPFQDSDFCFNAHPSTSAFTRRMEAPLAGSDTKIAKNPLYKWYCLLTGLLTNNSDSSLMYEEGYADAMRELVPKIVCHVGPRGARQSTSMGTLVQRSLLAALPTVFNTLSSSSSKQPVFLFEKSRDDEREALNQIG